MRVDSDVEYFVRVNQALCDWLSSDFRTFRYHCVLWLTRPCAEQVAFNQRGRNATQLNMAGTGIGTFNDRLRDAVMGGSPFAPSRCQNPSNLCAQTV